MMRSPAASAVQRTADASRIPVVLAGRTLAVASAGTLLVLLAFTVPLATLSATAADLTAGPGAQAWILSSMSIGCAAALLGSGAVGDDYGRRRMFVAGSLLLAVGSVLGALAPSAWVLVVARIVQGLGGAAVMACGLGLVGHVYPTGPDRARATAVWGAALGAGVAVGPFMAVAAQAVSGWRLAYWLAALGALLLALSGHRRLAESRSASPRRVDVAGMALLGLGLTVLLAGLIEGRTGWTRPITVSLLVGGIALIVGFAVVERRSASPMLDLGLLRRPDFVAATVAALAAGAGVLALMSFTPTLVERGLGGSALAGVSAMFAWSGLSAVTALAARWLPAWITARAQLIGGLLGCAVGQLAVLGLHPGSSIARLLLGLLIAGAANGILNAALGRQAVASVPADRAAMGSGANNTARYVGSAIGLAVVTVIITHAASANGTAGLMSGWNTAAAITAGFTLLGLAIVIFTRPQRRRSK
ncbi:MFS transporter [Hamadaea sp. NPDC051192]|uniref:MFS transporter n=1 Tax=Hamadaea sp. NPDC051192 TaxID=3154940 RepID=UPI00342D0C05